MGTSSSSRGPGSNVPFIPPWVPALPPPLPPPPDPSVPAPDDGEQQQPPLPTALPQPPAVLPAMPQVGRFRAARTSLGHYARTGSHDDLQRSLGHYTRSGLGGTGQATRRMAKTAINAGKIFQTLGALSSGSALPADVQLDPAALAGRSAEQVADEIARALQPPGGTQDDEASRDSISCALAELLDAEPKADLTSLTPEQIDLVTQAYVGEDLCRRVDLDIGKTIIDKAPTQADGVARLEGMKAYIRQEVARAFRTRSERGQRLTRQNASSLVAGVLESTFEVFEGYLK